MNSRLGNAGGRVGTIAGGVVAPVTSYRYRAVDQAGTPKEGVLAALDVADLTAKLEKQGLWLVKASEAPRPSTSSKHPSSGGKGRDIVDFAIHMNSLLSAGVPLLHALNSVEEHTPRSPFRATLQAVNRAVESGTALHQAMAQHPSVFPTMMVNLVRAGEESGTLPAMFQELQRYLEWADRMRGEVRQATIYPAMVILAVVALLILLFTFVIPRFIPVLADLKIDLPWLTALMFQVSEALVSTWWVWLPLLVVIPLAGVLLPRHIPQAAMWMDQLKLRLPIFGELNQMLALSRFTHNFAVLIRAGIPILQCLRLCQGVVGNRVVERALKETEQAVMEGVPISQSLGRHPVFPPLFLQMVAVGEGAGNLGQTMSNVSAFYSEDIPRRVKKVFAILEPVITLGLIGLVGTVALSIFLPILTLMSGMR